jgi:hypothetical protein
VLAFHPRFYTYGDSTARPRAVSAHFVAAPLERTLNASFHRRRYTAAAHVRLPHRTAARLSSFAERISPLPRYRSVCSGHPVRLHRLAAVTTMVRGGVFLRRSHVAVASRPVHRGGTFPPYTPYAFHLLSLPPSVPTPSLCPPQPPPSPDLPACCPAFFSLSYAAAAVRCRRPSDNAAAVPGCKGLLLL